MIEKVIIYTSSLRSALKLSGKRVQFLKNYLSRAFIDKDIVIDVRDDIIRNEFKNTYAFLNEFILENK